MAATAVQVKSLRPRLARRLPVARIGAGVLVVMLVLCVGSLPHTLDHFADTHLAENLQPPGRVYFMGSDALGRSMLVRCLLGGAISLGIGTAAALMSVVIGTVWGLVAGYAGGRIDGLMMRTVDVLYGLPYILLVVLLGVALQPALESGLGTGPGNFVTLLIAIGAVSWLTLARVVRGQVLSLRNMPFVEAARAAGLPTWRILFVHVLPNMVGPIAVYAALTIPQAILQESFLSFLGIGVREPVPSWGNLAAAGLSELNPIRSHWWLLVWPCLLLGITLLSLNFVGEALREKFDPRHAQR